MALNHPEFLDCLHLLSVPPQHFIIPQSIKTKYLDIPYQLMNPMFGRN